MDKEFKENPVEAYEKLKQKCERLKKEKAEILEKTGMIETLQGYTVKEIEYMEQQLDQLKAENEKLEQTLAEIKEYCIDHLQLINGAYPHPNIILDKINEVEDEKSNN